MARRRHLSRIAVMQALFEREKHPASDPAQSLAKNAEELGEMDMAFAQALLEGVLAREAEIVEAVRRAAPGWPVERMDPIARSVLLIGAYELLFAGDAPAAVVMNEAIDIAKEFGTDECGKFVNGVLNAIAHRSV